MRVPARPRRGGSLQSDLACSSYLDSSRKRREKVWVARVLTADFIIGLLLSTGTYMPIATLAHDADKLREESISSGAARAGGVVRPTR